MHAGVRWFTFIPFLLAVVLFAEDKKEQAAGLFQNAIKGCDIRTPSSPPFRLEAHITRKEKGKFTEGEYLEVWASPRQWRREITLGDDHFFQVSDPADEKHTWVAEPRRRLGFAREILEFAQFGDLQEENLNPKKVFQVSKNEVHLTCVEIKGEYGGKIVACFDSSTNFLQSVEHSSHGSTLRHEYSQYSPFGTVSFPRRMKSISLEFAVTKLAVEPNHDPAIFSIPQNAERRPACARTIPAHALSQPEPSYLGGESQRGTVVLGMIVDIDGRPHDITVTQSQGQALDAATLQAVRSWTFKPATCQGEPVPSFMIVEMSFH